AELAKQASAIVKALQSAMATHQSQVGAVAHEARPARRLGGIYYEELRRLARAARTVSPDEAASFAPSMHLQTRHASRRGGANAPPPSPAAPPAPAKA
ncbi:MAG: hypothetical protein ACHREM_32580, partial [Polyangiales bacterium]